MIYIVNIFRAGSVLCNYYPQLFRKHDPIRCPVCKLDNDSNFHLGLCSTLTQQLAILFDEFKDILVNTLLPFCSHRSDTDFLYWSLSNSKLLNWTSSDLHNINQINRDRIVSILHGYITHDISSLFRVHLIHYYTDFFINFKLRYNHLFGYHVAVYLKNGANLNIFLLSRNMFVPSF